MSTEAGQPPHRTEPLHVLMFYSFVSGFAGLLLDESHEHTGIDWYRAASREKSEEFARSASAQSELQIATALESYIDNRVFLLDGDDPRGRVSNIIHDAIVTQNLLLVREALSLAQGATWLSSDVDRSRQAFVDWSDTGEPPDLSTSDALQKTEAEVFARGRPVMDRIRRLGRERAAGAWWSAPAGAGLPCTTRKLDSVTAAGLICRDDSLGESRACAWDVHVAADAAVAEIHDVPDWQQLVTASPRLVSDSRQEEWSQRFGLPGPWFLPDWGELAGRWDGVHLSVYGYLRCQGQIAPVSDGRTVLVGWDPDATYWLRDAITLAGTSPDRWVRDTS
jgi:hypothetical protein